MSVTPSASPSRPSGASRQPKLPGRTRFGGTRSDASRPELWRGDLSRRDMTRRERLAAVLVGACLAVVGVPLALGGMQLAGLGGSWYYLLAGPALILAGVLVALGRAAGAWLFALVASGTVVWAFWEVGADFWMLVPRLGGFVALGVPVCLAVPALTQGRHRRSARAGALGLVLLLAGGMVAALQPQGVIRPAAPSPGVGAMPATGVERSDWAHYGRTPAGTRFAPFDQIDKDNVAELEVAWVYRTGDVPESAAEDQNTPLQVGDTLYVCTYRNRVIALDVDTGAEKWVFDPDAHSPVWRRCRGVGYYEMPDGGAPQEGECARRIVLNTVDARLIVLDAASGKPCDGFGVDGQVDLKRGMGEVPAGWYFPTAAPTVVRDLIVVGGWVFDGRSTDEPSGVLRAFSAITGEIVWAWDVGSAETSGTPDDSAAYTRSTPNVWSAPAFDDELGLLYVPTGNGTPDYWGAERSAATEKYSSSVVALDVTNGQVRWHFQTVHHDLWDYDVPAQPALYDIPDGKGGVIPALIQLTKRGQTFMFDRRDGTPLHPIEERAVPQGGQPGERLSPTQPYPVGGLPAIGHEPLTEARMWGTTWYDQLYCRIRFRSLRYEGDFTPPTTTAHLQWPGFMGGNNWGSASIDESAGLLYTNDVRIAIRTILLARDGIDVAQAEQAHGIFEPQHGAPYGVSRTQFRSPLGLPCTAPPYGTMTATDIATRKIVWQVPMGTIRDIRKRGIPVSVPVPLGMPTLGGPVSTASGLVFFAGSQDFFLRALDGATGDELWKTRLPVGAQGTPMSYVSPRTGRQYVAVSAGGARESSVRGDYVIAYGLPRTGTASD